jgi:hypothetical protein
MTEDHIKEIQRFDIICRAYTESTGRYAPGKSYPDAMGIPIEETTAFKAYSVWWKENGKVVSAVINAAFWRLGRLENDKT